MQLTENTILITGGGSGIGRGLAEAFHRLGNRVIIAGRGREKLDETVAANPGMEAMTLDVADPADIAGFAAKIAESFPALNVLINNAGIMKAEDVTDGAAEVAEATVAINLLGPIRLTAALLPHLLGRPGATVMTVTSGLAFVPIFPNPTYCATKAAIHSYSQTLRRQLAGKGAGKGVGVIEIVPPYVQTHLTGPQQAADPNAMPLDDYIAETMALLKADPDAEEVIVDRVKMQRNAERETRYAATFEKLNEMAEQRMAARAKGE